MKPTVCLAALATLILSVQQSLALRFEQIGPLPKGRPAIEQPGWPAGSGKVVGHASRVYSVGGNGGEQVYFQATPDEMSALLKLYSDMRMRDFQVIIKKGKQTIQSFQDQKIGWNVHLQIIDGMGVFMARTKDVVGTLEPTLTIHLDPATEKDFLAKVSIPAHVTVTSEIEGWPKDVKARPKIPKRENWHADVQFADGSPAVDFEGSVQTTVTFWDRDKARGIDLGRVNHEGKFKVPFSAGEVAGIQSGKFWLTLTPGNYLTKPLKGDVLLPIEKLVRDPVKATPIKIGKPAYHYGRLLFFDGEPAVLDRKLWKGSEISVNFAYAGRCAPDKEGYVKFFFTPKQFEELKVRKPGKNIHVPHREDRNTSTALWVFPAVSLTMDKETAGVLRIPRPGPPFEEKK